MGVGKGGSLLNRVLICHCVFFLEYIEQILMTLISTVIKIQPFKNFPEGSIAS